jgi:hypothetical protein
MLNLLYYIYKLYINYKKILDKYNYIGMITYNLL